MQFFVFMKRQELIEKLSDIIINTKLSYPVRVGIDGVDASGKTVLAEEIYNHLKQSSRQIIRVSIDGFHNPKKIRYQKGRNSAEGYYLDSFNNQAVIDNILIPLGPDGNLKYITKTFNFKIDQKVDSKEETANKNAILIMEGVFLFRSELINYWDLKIFVDADFKNTMERAKKRDGYYLGEQSEIEEKYNIRYIPGQKLYIEQSNPKEKADIVVDNNDFNNPNITKNKLT